MNHTVMLCGLTDREEIMRDINRIDPFMDKLKEFWKQFPDLRFVQLLDIINFHAEKKFKKDAFYLEDDEFLSIADEMNIDFYTAVEGKNKN
jgi:uncharacterized protein YihD (DUF1040 family)